MTDEALCCRRLLRVGQLSGNFGAFTSSRAAFPAILLQRETLSGCGRAHLAFLSAARRVKDAVRRLLSRFFNPTTGTRQPEDENAEDDSQTRRLTLRFEPVWLQF